MDQEILNELMEAVDDIKSDIDVYTEQVYKRIRLLKIKLQEKTKLKKENNN